MKKMLSFAVVFSMIFISALKGYVTQQSVESFVTFFYGGFELRFDNTGYAKLTQLTSDDSKPTHTEDEGCTDGLLDFFGEGLLMRPIATGEEEEECEGEDDTDGCGLVPPIDTEDEEDLVATTFFASLTLDVDVDPDLDESSLLQDTTKDTDAAEEESANFTITTICDIMDMDDVDTDLDTDLDTDIDTGRGIDTDTDTTWDTGIDTDISISVGADIDISANVDVGAGVEADIGVGASAKADADTDMGVEASTDMGAGADIGMRADVDTDVDVDTAIIDFDTWNSTWDTTEETNTDTDTDENTAFETDLDIR